jgi:hypothetical protein
VAKSYAIVTIAILAPVLSIWAARCTVVRIRDFAWIQLPACFAFLLAYAFVLRLGQALATPALLVCALVIAYGSTAMLVLATPDGRRTIKAFGILLSSQKSAALAGLRKQAPGL